MTTPSLLPYRQVRAVHTATRACWWWSACSPASRGDRHPQVLLGLPCHHSTRRAPSLHVLLGHNRREHLSPVYRCPLKEFSELRAALLSLDGAVSPGSTPPRGFTTRPRAEGPHRRERS
jgi:hypothetical protein